MSENLTAGQYFITFGVAFKICADPTFAKPSMGHINEKAKKQKISRDGASEEET